MCVTNAAAAGRGSYHIRLRLGHVLQEFPYRQFLIPTLDCGQQKIPPSLNEESPQEEENIKPGRDNEDKLDPKMVTVTDFTFQSRPYLASDLLRSSEFKQEKGENISSLFPFFLSPPVSPSYGPFLPFHDK